MGGYISTYLNTAPVQSVKDASGSTVLATDASSNDILPAPTVIDPQQSIEETVPITTVTTLPVTEQPVQLIEEVHKTIEKTVEVEALPNLHKTQINSKNKKKGKKQ